MWARMARKRAIHREIASLFAFKEGNLDEVKERVRQARGLMELLELKEWELRMLYSVAVEEKRDRVKLTKWSEFRRRYLKGGKLSDMPYRTVQKERIL